MHPRLLQLELLTDLDQERVCFLIGHTKVDEVAHEAAQLVEDQVLLVLELHLGCI
jgi:hypothetical protein